MVDVRMAEESKSDEIDADMHQVKELNFFWRRPPGEVGDLARRDIDCSGSS